jgi:lysyl-tRNA synthetase class 1
MGNPPKSTMIMNFIMLLNLASASGAESGDVLWKFIRRYHPEASPDTHPDLQKSVDYAIGYCHTRVIPHRKYRKPTEVEACALEASISSTVELMP